jgi:hypothetical protein
LFLQATILCFVVLVVTACCNGYGVPSYRYRWYTRQRIVPYRQQYHYHGRLPSLAQWFYHSATPTRTPQWYSYPYVRVSEEWVVPSDPDQIESALIDLLQDQEEVQVSILLMNLYFYRAILS